MNNKIIYRTIDIAKAMCPLNTEHRCSHIAFLIKSHPKTLNYAYQNHQLVGIHAELAVCMKSGKTNLRHFKMVVLRINRNGKLDNSRPCCGCQSVIDQFNVGDVWYSNTNGEVVKN